MMGHPKYRKDWTKGFWVPSPNSDSTTLTLSKITSYLLYGKPRVKDHHISLASSLWGQAFRVCFYCLQFKNTCLLKTEGRFVLPFMYCSMLLNINCWSSIHNWLRNWKADLPGSFSLIYHHPEYFDQMMTYSSMVFNFFSYRLLFSAQI